MVDYTTSIDSSSVPSKIIDGFEDAIVDENFPILETPVGYMGEGFSKGGYMGEGFSHGGYMGEGFLNGIESCSEPAMVEPISTLEIPLKGYRRDIKGADYIAPIEDFGKSNHKVNVKKGQWTSQEDKILVKLVQQYGLRRWSFIAEHLKGRIGKQCRERWNNHLRPEIKKGDWSKEEDVVLIQSHKEIGNRWAEITKRLPGRTENSVKNRWNATKRRQYTRPRGRQSRNPNKSDSLLMDYIKSLNFSKTMSIAAEEETNKDGAKEQPVPIYDFSGIPKFMLDSKPWDGDLFEKVTCEGFGAGGAPMELDVVADSWDVNPSNLEFECTRREVDLFEMMYDNNSYSDCFINV